MTVKSSISLTDQQDAFVRELVREGRYPSASAVLQQGLELLRQKTEAEAVEVEALRMLIDRRRAGAFVTAEEMGRRLDARLAGKRREHGLDD